MLLKSEGIEDGLGFVGKTLHIVDKVGRYVGRVALQLFKGEFGSIVEGDACDADKFSVKDTFPLVLGRIVFLQNFGFSRLQDTIKAAKDSQREHYILVLVRAVGPAKQVGYRPDEVSFFVKIDGGHFQSSWFVVLVRT